MAMSVTTRTMFLKFITSPSVRHKWPQNGRWQHCHHPVK
jgi:hypothetical protein